MNESAKQDLISKAESLRDVVGNNSGALSSLNALVAILHDLEVTVEKEPEPSESQVEESVKSEGEVDKTDEVGVEEDDVEAGEVAEAEAGEELESLEPEKKAKPKAKPVESRGRKKHRS